MFPVGKLLKSGITVELSKPLHENIPHGDDVAHGSYENKEMKHRVHVAALVKTVEHCTGDVGHAFGHNPNKGAGRQAVDQRLKSYQHAEPHAYETAGFYIAVILQPSETQ